MSNHDHESNPKRNSNNQSRNQSTASRSCIQDDDPSVLFMVLDISGSTVMIIKELGTSNLLHLAILLLTVIIYMNLILILIITMGTAIIPHQDPTIIKIMWNLIRILIPRMMIIIKSLFEMSMSNWCP
jgi:hypothetical protein